MVRFSPASPENRRIKHLPQSLPHLPVIHRFCATVAVTPLQEAQMFRRCRPEGAPLDIQMQRMWCLKVKHNIGSHRAVHSRGIARWSFPRYLGLFQCSQRICCSLNVFTQANPTREKLSCLHWNLDKKNTGRKDRQTHITRLRRGTSIRCHFQFFSLELILFQRSSALRVNVKLLILLL